MLTCLTDEYCEMHLMTHLGLLVAASLICPCLQALAVSDAVDSIESTCFSFDSAAAITLLLASFI